jgi:type II secretory pathway pseudopilin PulG
MMIKTNFKNGFTYTLTFKRKLVCGFTLLEALVAISILMVAVVSPITIAQKGLSSASYSKSQMIASYLAQDAIEYVKNVRDNNKLANESDWLKDLEDCQVSDGCQIDTIEEGVLSYSPSLPSPLLLDKDSGFYGYKAGGDPTNFARQITITNYPYGNNSDEAMVTVKVSWGTDNVEVKTIIYNY